MSDGESTTNAAKRPRYLVLALAALTLVGMLVFLEGFQLINASTDPEFATRESAKLDPIISTALHAQFERMWELHQVITPMGVALVLFGGVLSIVAMRGIFGRASASTIIQLALGTAIARTVSFVLCAPVRAAAVAAVASMGQAEAQEVARFLPAIFVVPFALPLLTLLLAIFGVTRRAAREALSASSEQVGEEQ